GESSAKQVSPEEIQADKIASQELVVAARKPAAAAAIDYVHGACLVGVHKSKGIADQLARHADGQIGGIVAVEVAGRQGRAKAITVLPGVLDAVGALSPEL